MNLRRFLLFATCFFVPNVVFVSATAQTSPVKNKLNFVSPLDDYWDDSLQRYLKQSLPQLKEYAQKDSFNFTYDYSFMAEIDKNKKILKLTILNTNFKDSSLLKSIESKLKEIVFNSPSHNFPKSVNLMWNHSELYPAYKVNSKDLMSIGEPLVHFDESVHTIYTDSMGVIEEKAKFRVGEAGFNKFIEDNFVYPERCLEEGLECKVTLSMMINKYGVVSQVKVTKETPQCPECEREAIRVMSKTNNLWIPAKIKGHYVTSIRTVTITRSIK